MENRDEKEFLERVRKAAAEGARQGAGNNVRTELTKVLVKYLVPVALVMVLLLAIVPRLSLISGLRDFFGIEKPVDQYDMTISNNGVFGYKAADFIEAIIGEQTSIKELEVLEYKISDAAIIKDTGLANLSIFTKMQLITYHGTAIYTVDLSKITESSIRVDTAERKVVMTIPHAKLKTIDINSNDIEFSDVERGFLAFGDLTLTPEQAAKIQSETQERMKQKLLKEQIYKEADRFAQMNVWGIYQPLVASVSRLYTLDVVFE